MRRSRGIGPKDFSWGIAEQAGQDGKWPIRKKLKNFPARIHGPASASTGSRNRMTLLFPVQGESRNAARPAADIGSLLEETLRFLP